MKKVLVIIVLLSLNFSLFGQDLTSKKGDKGLYGFVNKEGEVVIAPQYDEVHFEFVDGVACIKKGKLFYLIDSSNKMISDGFAWVDYFDSQNRCLVSNGGKYDEKGVYRGGNQGMVDKTGKKLLDTKYSSIDVFNENGVAKVNVGGKFNQETGELEGGKFGFVDVNGTVLIEPKYVAVGEYNQDGMAWVNVGGKIDEKTDDIIGGLFGYVDNKGQEVIAPNYSYMGKFDDQGICWVNKGGLVFKSNASINSAVEAARKTKSKEELRDYREALTAELYGDKIDILLNRIYGGKFGYVDKTGREIAEVKYTGIATNFKDDRASVRLGKKMGYIDSQGKEVVPIVYSSGSNEFHNGMAWISEGDKKAVMNRDGKILTPFKYNEIGTFEDGVAFAMTSTKEGKNTVNKYGLIDTNGNELTSFKYDKISDPSHGMRYGIIGRGICSLNNKGEEIIPMVFSAIPYQEGFCVGILPNDVAKNPKGVKLNSLSTDIHSHEDLEKYTLKYGLIDQYGVVITDFVYDSTLCFSEGLAAFKKGGKYGWMDTQGNHTIEATYDKNASFIDGYAPAQLNGKYGFLDKSGAVALDFKYSNSGDKVSNGVFVVRNESQKWGGVTIDGEEVIPFLLPQSDLIYKLIDEVYLPNGKKRLTTKDVRNFGIYQSLDRNKTKIGSVISDHLWDF